MDGLGRAIGAAVPLKLDGKTYLVAGLGLEDYGIIEQAILKERSDGGKDPLVSTLARLESIRQNYPDAYRQMVDRLMDDVKTDPDMTMVSEQEQQRWMLTPRGRVFCMWLSLRQNHPEITLEEAERVVDGEQRQLSVAIIATMRNNLARLRERSVSEATAEVSPDLEGELEGDARAQAADKVAEKIDSTLAQACGTDLRGN